LQPNTNWRTSECSEPFALATSASVTDIASITEPGAETSAHAMQAWLIILQTAMYRHNRALSTATRLLRYGAGCTALQSKSQQWAASHVHCAQAEAASRTGHLPEHRVHGRRLEVHEQPLRQPHGGLLRMEARRDQQRRPVGFGQVRLQRYPRGGFQRVTCRIWEIQHIEVVCGGRTRCKPSCTCQSLCKGMTCRAWDAHKVSSHGTWQTWPSLQRCTCPPPLPEGWRQGKLACPAELLAQPDDGPDKCRVSLQAGQSAHPDPAYSWRPPPPESASWR